MCGHVIEIKKSTAAIKFRKLVPTDEVILTPVQIQREPAAAQLNAHRSSVRELTDMALLTEGGLTPLTVL
jgi:hypothetical protein